MKSYPIAIIGAGFSGLVAAIRLQAAGYNNFTIFEQASQVGGTWRDNTYPGCACDVPSNLYSISSELNPNWSHLYASQAEILDYMIAVFQKHGLDKHTQFNTEIIKYQFLPDQNMWQLQDRQGKSQQFRVVISATGPLNRVKLPDIPGIESFQGKTMHSAQWDHSYDFSQKRIAVIGTGASAIQIVPALAPIVKNMMVFQRTAPWIGPRLDRPISNFRKKLYKFLPFTQMLSRTAMYRFMEWRGKMFIGNEKVHQYFEKISLKKLAYEVYDPAVRAKLTPNYKLGCKRILSSDDYLPSFNRDNVLLETTAIKAITATGIELQDGKHHPFDAIIYATGFEVAEITHDATIQGLQHELFAKWKETGLQAYRGTTIADFPNLIFMLGPNTGLGHSSMIHMMESQMYYILNYLKLLEKEGPKAALNLKPSVQSEYNNGIQQAFGKTVWNSGCKSWYMDSQGRNTTLYPKLTTTYRQEMKQFNPADYQVITI